MCTCACVSRQCVLVFAFVRRARRPAADRRTMGVTNLTAGPVRRPPWWHDCWRQGSARFRFGTTPTRRGFRRRPRLKAGPDGRTGYGSTGGRRRLLLLRRFSYSCWRPGDRHRRFRFLFVIPSAVVFRCLLGIIIITPASPATGHARYAFPGCL